VLGEAAQATLTAARAVDDDLDLPPPPERNDPTRVPDADAYTGDYRCKNRTIAIAAESGRLRHTRPVPLCAMTASLARDDGFRGTAQPTTSGLCQYCDSPIRFLNLKVSDL
jgi:hypothetical protein